MSVKKNTKYEIEFRTIYYESNFRRNKKHYKRKV